MTRLDWLDLYVDGDPHPRRFDSRESARTYLLRVERLPEDAVQLLLNTGLIDPPEARRAYRLRPLGA